MMYQAVHRVHQLTISEINQKIILLSRFNLQAAARDLDAAHHTIHAKLGSILEFEKSRLAHFENLMESNHPVSILKKGFSITRLNGKSISTRNQLEPGMLIETEFFDGKVISKVE
jgi:exodeoxyribonuclease VII large subunit